MKIFGRPAWETWPLRWWLYVIVIAVLTLALSAISPLHFPAP